jgi:hypothetical protein
MKCPGVIEARWSWRKKQEYFFGSLRDAWPRCRADHGTSGSKGRKIIRKNETLGKCVCAYASGIAHAGLDFTDRPGPCGEDDNI